MAPQFQHQRQIPLQATATWSTMSSMVYGLNWHNSTHYCLDIFFWNRNEKLFTVMVSV
jgi:hypothetical protein